MISLEGYNPFYKLPFITICDECSHTSRDFQGFWTLSPLLTGHSFKLMVSYTLRFGPDHNQSANRGEKRQLDSEKRDKESPRLADSHRCGADLYRVLSRIKQKCSGCPDYPRFSRVTPIAFGAEQTATPYR